MFEVNVPDSRWNAPDMVEALMGHNSYLSGSYRRYTKDQMYEYYQKSEHLLYINQVDINKIDMSRNLRYPKPINRLR